MRVRVPPSTADSGWPSDRAYEIPDGHLDAGLGHVVAAHAPQRRKHVARMLEGLSVHQRHKEAFEDVPDRFGRFRCCSTDWPRQPTRPTLRGRRPRRAPARRCGRRIGRNSSRRNGRAATGTGTTRPSRSSRLQTILGCVVAFHYLAIEGPIGVGKTRLAERLAARLDATTILEDTENPFLRISTPIGPARRCRLSCSTCSTATGS